MRLAHLCERAHFPHKRSVGQWEVVCHEEVLLWVRSGCRRMLLEEDLWIARDRCESVQFPIFRHDTCLGWMADWTNEAGSTNACNRSQPDPGFLYLRLSTQDARTETVGLRTTFTMGMRSAESRS